MNNLLKITVLLFVSSNTVLAEPTVNIETKYYSIYGLSSKELRKEMNTRSSISQSGKTYDAYTSWHVNWRFNWNTINGECQMTRVSSTVDVKFTLPKWMNRNDANNSLIHHWDTYYTALIDHENGHKNFGIDAAREIENRLLKLSSNNCSSLEKKANSLGKKILNKYISIEKKYDRTTNHGMNNGAIFP